MEPVNLRMSKVSLTAIHEPYQLPSRSIFFLCTYIPQIQSTEPPLASLDNTNKCGAQLLRDLEHLELNVFNQLLSLQLMGFLGPKAILR